MDVKTEDLSKAAEDLEALVKAGDGEKGKEPTVEEQLAKAQGDLADARARLEKAEKGRTKAEPGTPGEDVDEPDENKARRGGKDADKSAARDTLFRGAADTPASGELFDASEELKASFEGLVTAMGKSLEMLETQIAERRDADARIERIEVQVGALVKAMGAVVASETALHKSVGGIQVKATAPGVVGKLGDRVIPADGGLNGAPKDGLAKAGDVNRADAQIGIEKAVNAGALEPEALLMFNRLGAAYLARIPDEVAKSYGIPRPATA